MESILQLAQVQNEKHIQKYSQNEAAWLVEYANKQTIFRGTDGKAYISLARDGHHETYLIGSKAFKSWLRSKYWEAKKKTIGSQCLLDAVSTLESHAFFSAIEHPVFFRIGEVEEKIYIDLCDTSWQVVEISNEGWRTINAPNVRFRRSKGQLPLPQPDLFNRNVNVLWRIINIEQERHRRLYIVWIVFTLNPRGPYVHLALFGTQGTGKTTTARLTKALVDPSRAPVRSLPRNEQDLLIAANNSWVAAFDNLSGLTDAMADAFCRLSTGGGQSSRELYSNDEEVLFDLQRALIFNSIDDIVTRPDLADRCLPIRLSEIEPEMRRSDDEIESEFRKLQPQIFAGLLDLYSKAIQVLPTLKFEKLPRMAKFAKLGMAVYIAMGLTPESFLKDYEGLMNESIKYSAETNEIVQSIEKLLNSKCDFWEGSCTELMEELRNIVSPDFKKSKQWPVDPRAMSDRLNRLQPLFKPQGIRVMMGDSNREAGTGRRLVTIQRV